jgi:hypothetical protein
VTARQILQGAFERRRVTWERRTGKAFPIPLKKEDEYVYEFILDRAEWQHHIPTKYPVKRVLIRVGKQLTAIDQVQWDELKFLLAEPTAWSLKGDQLRVWPFPDCPTAVRVEYVSPAEQRARLHRR